MAKRADYLISAVRFNSAGAHIDKVKAHPDNGESFGDPVATSRQLVISRLKSGTTYCTMFQKSDGKWYQGAMVKIVAIDGQEYIKTRADNTKRDNLDDLPMF